MRKHITTHSLSRHRNTNTMDTSVEGHLLPEPEVGLPQHFDANQDDDFDFEIGGDDAFDLTVIADNEIIVPKHQVDANDADAEAHDDQSYMYQSQEYDAQASVAEEYDGAEFESGHEVTDVTPFGLDSLTETDGHTQDAQAKVDSHDEVVDLGNMDLNVEDGAHDEMYYDETVGESEPLHESGQSELMQDHGLENVATSVGSIHEEDGLQESNYQPSENGAGTAQSDIDFPPEPQSVVEKTHSDETFGAYEPAEHADVLSADDAKEVEAGDDAHNAEVLKSNDPGDAIDASQDQSNWAEDDDDEADNEDRIFTGPIVTVFYLGQEYSMFAQSTDDDPDSYFLSEVDSIHQPLSQFLGNLREVVASELEAGQELGVRIDGLGLEFAESTAKEFLDQTTLAMIIDVNNKLTQQDGGSQHAELYILLSVQPNPLNRFKELVSGAEAGLGLSHFEQYYEPSGDASLDDDEEELDVSDVIDPEDLSDQEPFSKLEEAAYGISDSSGAQQLPNPFSADGQQSLLEGLLPSTAPGTDSQTNDTDRPITSLDRNTFNALNGSKDAGHDGGQTSEVIDTDLLPGENTFDGTVATADQTEAAEMGDKWASDSNMDAYSEPQTMGNGEREGQAEVLVDNSEEGLDGTDGESSFSLRGSGCMAPNFCVCENCYDFDLGFEAELDQLTIAAPSSPGPVSNAFTDAEWDAIMDCPSKDNTAADMPTQDYTAHTANDEDYLDLGDANGDQMQSADHTTTNGVLAAQLDIQRQMTPNSSVTGTLNGEETGHGDEAATSQSVSADPEQYPDQTNDIENTKADADEIDWNHDEDNESDAANLNPATPSPSSLSVKRSRQDDEVTEGLGEDTGMSWVWSIPRKHANYVPAAKRRRT